MAASPQEAAAPEPEALNTPPVSGEAPAPPSEASPPQPFDPLNLYSSPAPATYEGTEYRWRNFRVRPAEFKFEPFLLLAVVGTIVWGLAGRRTNTAKATGFWKALRPWLQTEFAHVGADEPDAMSSDGPQTFLGYASGRRGCSGLTIRLDLRPRQDPIMLFYEVIRSVVDVGWTGHEDRVTAEWRIPANVEAGQETGELEPKDGWVFAIVNKQEMGNVRSDRWDVKTFTEVKESPLLPPRFVLMSESGDVTDAILKSVPHLRLPLSETDDTSQAQGLGHRRLADL